MLNFDMKGNILLSAAMALMAATASFAAEPVDSLDTTGVALEEVSVVGRKLSTRKLKGSATDTEVITSAELLRAACCNLGESFATNPSVDVSYSDAATGARQIKLLGLSGAYVQMLTENIPNLRGAAMPYGLGYVAGPWIQSIQVSKGASSVKNGYESISGQVDIEYKKPQADREVSANLYGDMMTKAEVNANANWWLGGGVSTAVLFHAEDLFNPHDGNGDSFVDMPRNRQLAVMNRWAWMGRNNVAQGGVKFLGEKRRSGQLGGHHSSNHGGVEPYLVDIATNRFEAFAKNAYIFDKVNDGNVAGIVSFSSNDQRSNFGHRDYDVVQNSLYLSLMFERKWQEGRHALSTGYNLNFDHFRQVYAGYAADSPVAPHDVEAVNGCYGQYTYSPSSLLVVMAGLRYDYNSRHGHMVTPRLHARLNPSDWLSAHASIGRGFHSPRVMAENHYVLSSSRLVVAEGSIGIEDAVNSGIGATATFYADNRPLAFSVEYYHTYFRHRMVADFDSDPYAVVFKNVDGTRSHSLQFELNWQFLPDFDLTAAYRMNRAPVNVGFGDEELPLASRSKGLVSVSWQPDMSIWQVDLTAAFNGSGRMPRPYELPDGGLSWPRRYGAFTQLNAQVTRNFRHWSVYAGGENLTGYRQKNPIIGANDPFSPGFDATMVYAPLHGALFYVGLRVNFTRY